MFTLPVRCGIYWQIFNLFIYVLLVPVDLLTSTSTSSPAEYGETGVGKVDRYGCSIHGKYFPEGSKVPPTPNKPCEHCYCIHNMTTCVMQECTLHVDGCTPIYHKDVCCPIRYSCGKRFLYFFYTMYPFKLHLSHCSYFIVTCLSLELCF